VIWESNTILRYLAASYAPEHHRRDAGRAHDVERWMDWLLASINAPYLALFRDAKKKPEERGADWGETVQDDDRTAVDLDAHLAKREWVALDRLTIGGHRALAGDQALPRFPDRAPCPAGAREVAGQDRRAPGVSGRDRREAEHAAALEHMSAPSSRPNQRLATPSRRRCASCSACCCSAWWRSMSRARCAATSRHRASSARTSSRLHHDLDGDGRHDRGDGEAAATSRSTFW
jgi:hypothetical protein